NFNVRVLPVENKETDPQEDRHGKAPGNHQKVTEYLDGKSEAESNLGHEVDAEISTRIRLGRMALEEGDLIAGYELWKSVLELDPENEIVQKLLRDYADRYEIVKAEKTETESKIEAQEQVLQILEEKSFVLEQSTQVSIRAILETMNSILESASLAGDIVIEIGEDVDGELDVVTTEELTYRQFFDDILPLEGFDWSIDPETETIRVKRDLVTERFPLSDEVFEVLNRHVRQAREWDGIEDPSRAIRDLIIGQVRDQIIDPRVEGSLFLFNPSLRDLVVKDTRSNIKRVRSFLEENWMDVVDPNNPPIVKRIYDLPTSHNLDLARILNLLFFGRSEFENQLSQTGESIFFEPETGTLHLAGTQDKHDLVQRLLASKDFIDKVAKGKLKVHRFNVAPLEDGRKLTQDTLLWRRKQTNLTRQIFRSFLYSPQSVEEAAAEGRVMHANLNAGTIAVIDTPKNLERLDHYAESWKGERAPDPNEALKEEPSSSHLKAWRFEISPDKLLKGEDLNAKRRRLSYEVNFAKQVLQSLLYGNQSIEEAAAEGRVMYPDLSEGTIDIIDTPENLRKVAAYLANEKESAGQEVPTDESESDLSLRARKFLVVPPDLLVREGPQSAMKRNRLVNEMSDDLKDLLYGGHTLGHLNEAASYGRVMYPSLDKGTIDVVDTPESLQRVADYLASRDTEEP
ncbi:MAG: hypothetical protein KC964_15720, partial [Candidatus Omnitrophica bacterium]|nr:hypothetical protein [Candidatus Omnitrophota bacterium]